MDKKSIKAIFFDLDRTLWDFEKNSNQALGIILKEAELDKKLDVNRWLYVYQHLNQLYWEAYRKEFIDQETLRYIRFNAAFSYFGIKDEALAKHFAKRYVELSPKQNNLYPNCLETLTKLKEKYPLYIITNGFHDVQEIKMVSSGLSPFFEMLVSSDSVKVKKPNPKIFHYTKGRAKLKDAWHALYIGDDLKADMQGAKNAGLQSLHFSPHRKSSWEYSVSDLAEIPKLLGVE